MASLLDEDLDPMVSEESKVRNELTEEIDVLEQGARILVESFDAVAMFSEAITREAYYLQHCAVIWTWENSTR